MDRHFTTEAIIIKKKILKESDILITLLTPQKGKITTLAKGAQNIKSRRIGSLQLGNVVKVHLYQKNDSIWLSEVSSINSFLQSPKSLTQLNLLFYFLEIINHFIAQNQQIDGVYHITINIVDSIMKNKVDKYIHNEINLLKVLGFGIPPEIEHNYSIKDYKLTQNLIKKFLESIIEKPLESNKLFK